MQQQHRERKAHRSKDTKVKLKRNQRTYAKILEYHTVLKEEKSNNTFYQSGTAMDDDDVEAGESPRKKRKTGEKSPTGEKPDGMKEDNWCKSCLQWGHKRSNSTLCPNNKKKKAPVLANMPSVEELEAMTEAECVSVQMAALDSVALEEEDDEAVDDLLLELMEIEEDD
ncbi:hypothetical protein SEMRO_515_G158310.1 [Seminavis robusta]|uniref:Uncharacterized protein n=1 Tax=Seminavis robusta TaxID=568900 RepID=A0A9N8E022_9STRA|nr:hypothetical protein SEMRO_515_G158310.1 [Seminavis robusta]|eukprot:Sro515_g158310.1 n/a (169) ;mRNA; r:32841-33347